MMDRTDRHFRYFLRLLAPDIRLYTEMVVDLALLHGDRDRLLGYAEVEHPVALQLGGSEPSTLAAAAAIGEQWGYDEINLNIGCPSDRVQSGRFGACLMADARRVAECVAAIRAQVNIPVSIKTRIGIDDRDDYGFLRDFVALTAEAGCRMYIVHARKAILEGLSPKENRSIPPLNYPRVYRLKRDHPDLRVIINGGIRESTEVRAHLAEVDGVMIGRQAYSNPYWMAELQAEFFGDDSMPSREEVMHGMADYAARELVSGGRLSHITRHILGLYTGCPGARDWRRYLTEESRCPDAGAEVLVNSLAALSPQA